VNDRRRAIGQRQQEVVRGRRRGDDPPAHRRQFMSGSSSRLSSAPSRSRRSRSARANPGRSCHGLGKTRSSSHDSIRRLLQRPCPIRMPGAQVRVLASAARGRVFRTPEQIGRAYDDMGAVRASGRAGRPDGQRAAWGRPSPTR
jgi:hypothetical protein